MIPQGINSNQSGGFPHSEIHGSKPIPGSPWLIAGYHVLHRLLLPRHPPNALIALDLTRKTKDRASLRRPLVPLAGPARRLRSKACIYSRPFRRRDLVSVLDLDNAAVGFQPEDWRPPLPHSGTADNADYLSERCEDDPEGSRPIGRESIATLSGQIGRWWSLTESNRRHPACKAGALPTELRPRLTNDPVEQGPKRHRRRADGGSRRT